MGPVDNERSEPGETQSNFLWNSQYGINRLAINCYLSRTYFKIEFQYEYDVQYSILNDILEIISRSFIFLPSSISGGSPPTNTFLENLSVEFGSKWDAPGGARAASWLLGDDLAPLPPEELAK